MQIACNFSKYICKNLTSLLLRKCVICTKIGFLTIKLRTNTFEIFLFIMSAKKFVTFFKKKAKNSKIFLSNAKFSLLF